MTYTYTFESKSVTLTFVTLPPVVLINHFLLFFAFKNKKKNKNVEMTLNRLQSKKPKRPFMIAARWLVATGA